MTYQEIITALAKSRADIPFQNAIYEEAEELCTREHSHRTGRKQDAVEYAQELYTRDVNEWLGDSARELTPDDILNFRRRAVCWAVATLIRQTAPHEVVPCPHGLDVESCMESCRHYAHGSEQECEDCRGL